MRNKSIICLLFLLAACTTKKIEPPEQTNLNVQMAAEGADRFEHYIHSLTIYAFRRIADQTYVYDLTLAVLDSAGIAALEEGGGTGNKKVFKMNVPVGNYRLFFVGNADGRIEGELIPGVTLPQEIVIPGRDDGDENIYFLGNVNARIVSEFMEPISVTLSRAVGKLIFVLRQVPAQLDSIRMQIGGIASEIAIDGTLSETPTTIRKTWKLDSINAELKDTIVLQALTMPTITTSSPFQLTFITQAGQEKTKDMPPLIFQPDKYIRLTATINDDPGALLSFNLTVTYFIFDYWENKYLPDMPLTPDNQ